MEELKEEFNRFIGEIILFLLDYFGLEGVSGFSLEDYVVFNWYVNIVGLFKSKVLMEMVFMLLVVLVGVIC